MQCVCNVFCVLEGAGQKAVTSSIMLCRDPGERLSRVARAVSAELAAAVAAELLSRVAARAGSKSCRNHSA